ncbi:type IV conjugative transfer system lipoprotein TraV [Vibrio aestuarianus subsp. cardii]|uniref:type IV conjugative transfer system lipoprotein TraV n=1 Tax=Vibrio aestuarianus TaxID=28171 RepID=UPI0015588F5D|nr:type IV conjugative transfer system lipoprotein TraV [Vibrio aestuarianus]NGZ66615.1 type IV conjugative transfer system lipoprotein TraV [Vibrio aestuarianus subsp. cardii]
MKKNILLLICVAVLGGCSIGQSEFNCSRGDDNALCGSSRTIYAATNGELQENETLTFIENGEHKQVTLTELEQARTKKASDAAKAKNGEISEIFSDQANYSKVPHKFSYDGQVLRTDVKVLRVWIAPYVDDTDDLNLSTLVYTDIEKKRWELDVNQEKIAKFRGKTEEKLAINNFAVNEKPQKEYRPSEQDVQRIQTRMNDIDK